MKLLILGLLPWLIMYGSGMDVDNFTDHSVNKTHPDNDLYVIHATVYQVGILTNKTDNSTDSFNSTGNQESITLYSRNGSNIDLSGIPEPLLTNVTAQSIVGVAPVHQASTQNMTSVWNKLRMVHPGAIAKENSDLAAEESPSKRTTKTTNDFLFRLFKRDITGNTPLKMVNGTAVVPPEAGVQSIALPPLLSLNNNLSNIPVPIPNTAVVHYAKVNTLIQKP